MPWSGNKAPLQTTEDGQALAFWMEDELERFANEQVDNLQAIDLRPTYNPPLRPRQGMIAYADGVKWNPGSGEGLYIYNGLGVWVPVLWQTQGQISFPPVQVVSADPNTLDDYEEGTGTPTITFGGAAVGITYSTQTLRYTKIGNLVFFNLALVLTSKGSSTGAIRVLGLPFTALDTCPIVFMVATAAASAATQVTGQILTGTSQLVLQRFAAGTQTQLADTDFTNTSILRASGCYHV